MSLEIDYAYIYELMDKLCKNLTANAGISITEKQHRGVLRHVTNYISNCPNALGFMLPFDEASLIRKITRQFLNLNGNNVENSHMETLNIADENNSAGVIKPDFSKLHTNIFLNLFEQLKSSQFDALQRSALLTFLFFMANARISHENILEENYRKKIRPSRRLNRITFGDILHNDFIGNTQQSYQFKPTGKSAENFDGLMETTLANINGDYKSHIVYKTHMDTREKWNANQTSPAKNSPRRISTPKTLKGPLTYADFHLPNRNDEIVQNAIYSFTGIQGKYLKKVIATGKFKLDSKIKTLSVIQAGMLLRLSDLGYYHDLVKSFTDNNTGLCALGLMGQGFISALKTELTKYYGMVSILQEQLNRQRNFTKGNVQNFEKKENLTLLKLLVWSVEPLEHLQCLAKIAQSCQKKKGGALASAIYNFLNNGNPLVKNLSRKLLIAVCGPLYQMLTRWLLEGKINDLNAEFFIECLSEVTKDRLWHDKYRVRSNMLPRFISSELAQKILVTGKNINFLCVICEDKHPVKERDDLRQCIEENPENIFSIVSDTKLHSVIDTIYLSTSKRVLDMVVGPHKLLDHLQAMRRYLLLGQGDFIASIMENLKIELDKPATELYLYDLSSIMDAAIRSTNAHYAESEILNHLDVKLLKPCGGDIGWDILMLIYIVRGPLSAMLEPSMIIYQILFKSLWRMKHMEFVLSTKIWKEQKCNAKGLRDMAIELKGVLYRLHLFTSEMIHFINQMEYYILFEVIECAWAELHERVQQATALDDILNAHNEFLSRIKAGVFLDNDSEKLNAHLESVYGGIVQLEIWQEKFYQLCFNELSDRRKHREEIIRSELLGDFGLTNENVMKREQEKKMFTEVLAGYSKSLERIGEDYERGVRNFLMALNSHNDHNLQLFGIRLDFNEYYKKRDQSLSVPLTFEHMRMSNIFNINNKSLYSSNRYSVY